MDTLQSSGSIHKRLQQQKGSQRVLPEIWKPTVLNHADSWENQSTSAGGFFFSNCKWQCFCSEGKNYFEYSRSLANFLEHSILALSSLANYSMHSDLMHCWQKHLRICYKIAGAASYQRVLSFAACNHWMAATGVTYWKRFYINLAQAFRNSPATKVLWCPNYSASTYSSPSTVTNSSIIECRINKAFSTSLTIIQMQRSTGHNIPLDKTGLWHRLQRILFCCCEIWRKLLATEFKSLRITESRTAGAEVAQDYLPDFTLSLPVLSESRRNFLYDTASLPVMVLTQNSCLSSGGAAIHHQLYWNTSWHCWHHSCTVYFSTD